MIMLRQSGRGFKAEKKVISKRFTQPSILPRACQWIHVHAPKQCANAQTPMLAPEGAVWSPKTKDLGPLPLALYC